MRLAKLSAFRSLIFAPGSEPTMATLRARINEIPGGTVQLGHYFVDLDAYDSAMRLRDQLEARQTELKADPRLAGLV